MEKSEAKKLALERSWHYAFLMRLINEEEEELLSECGLIDKALRLIREQWK